MLIYFSNTLSEMFKHSKDNLIYTQCKLTFAVRDLITWNGSSSAGLKRVWGGGTIKCMTWEQDDTTREV